MSRYVWPTLVLALLVPPCRADDWPQWRGPTGQGTTAATNLPPRLDGGLAVRWKTPLPGEGCSSPIVRGDRTYVTTAYPGEEPHPWDRAAAVSALTLTAGVIALTLTRTLAALQALLATSSTRRRGFALATHTLAAAALAVLTLAKPTWFWKFADPWTGTTDAEAELAFVETFHLRPVIIFLIGSLAIVFARLAPRLWSASDANPAHPAFLSWLDWLTNVATLAFALAIGLVAWRPDWFWQPGQPWLAWLITGGLALLGVAISVGWLAPATMSRALLISVGIGIAVWLYGAMPLDQFATELDFRLRFGSLLPGLILLFGHNIVFAAARWRPLTTSSSASPLLAILLLALTTICFVRSNYLHAEIGITRAVVCLDTRSGMILWHSPVATAPAEKAHVFNSHATPTPAADAERVYAYFGSVLAALDHDGQALWIKRDPDYHRFCRYGTGSSLTLANDLVIVYRDSEFQGHGDHLDDDVEYGPERRPSALIAFDSKTGNERWRVSPEWSHDSYMTPLVWTHDGELEVVVATWKTLAAFSARDGSLRWKLPYPMQQVVPSLAVDGGNLFVTGGNLVPFPLHGFRPPSGEKQGKALWASKTGGASMASPVCWKGRLYALSHVGVLSCRTCDTGKIKWTERLDGRRFLASLVAGEDKVYMVDQDGTLFVVAAADDPLVLAKLALDDKCAATPALAAGCIFVRTAGHLVCIQSSP